jgi:alcohol dehydrogenase (NADP+)
MGDSMKYYSIGDGGTIPALGLGTWKSSTGDVGRAVQSAVDCGYRHIDCASIYQNQKEIGEALAEKTGKKAVKREDLWITSKLWNNAHAARHVRPALEATLRDLRLDYLDLYLIHWPVLFKENIVFPRRADQFLPEEAIPVMETWQAMEKLVKSGMCRFIGVCNFNLARMQDLVAQAHLKPAMNQIELHPYLQQNGMLSYCRDNGILVTAYSPLGSSDRPAGMKKEDEPSLLADPVIVELARGKGVSPAQLLIGWALSRDTVVIPKSTDPGRQRENLEAADVVLDAAEIERLNSLERNYRFVDGSFFASPGSPYSVEGLWG